MVRCSMVARIIQSRAEIPSAVFDAYYNKEQKKWYTNVSSYSMFYAGQNLQSGSSNPGYKDRIFKGADAGSAYTRKAFKFEPGLVRMSTLGQYYNGSRIEVYYPSPLPALTYDASSVILEASSRLKRKLREFTGQSNQLTNLVELRDLPRTIRGVAGSAGKLVSTVLNSKRRGAELKKFASDQWLTWSFGVLPTLGAIDDAVSSIGDYLSRDDHSIREYGVHARDWKSSFTTLTTGSMGAQVRRSSQWDHSVSCKITAGYRFPLKSANNYTLGKHLGFDISSVIPTAWELLPYSWLVDYFTTAGSFLEDTFAGNPGTSIYMYQTVRYRVSGIESYTPSVLNGWALDYFYTRPTKFEYFELIRSALPNLPHAPLRFKTTDEIASNAVNKLLNLTALLGSRKL